MRFRLSGRGGRVQDEAPEKYQTHFKAWIDAGLDPDGIEDLYKEVHEAIRADPLAQKKERSTPDEKKKWKAAKLTYDERKAALKARLFAPAGSCCGPGGIAWEHALCLHTCQQGLALRCRVKASFFGQEAPAARLRRRVRQSNNNEAETRVDTVHDAAGAPGGAGRGG